MPRIRVGPNFRPTCVNISQSACATAITVDDLNQLRLRIASEPEVPEGEWYKDFGSFKICGDGKFPKTFLMKGQVAKGHAL